MTERKQRAAQRNRKFPVETLLQSKQIKGVYQPDFARVVLSEPAYTLREAVDLLEKQLGKGQ